MNLRVPHPAPGGTFMEVVKKLYAEGGIPRFYRGLAPGLIQARCYGGHGWLRMVSGSGMVNVWLIWLVDMVG